MTLKEWRLRQKLTQDQLAKKLTKYAMKRVTQRNISAWENNVLPRKRFWITVILKFTQGKVSWLENMEF